MSDDGSDSTSARVDGGAALATMSTRRCRAAGYPPLSGAPHQNWNVNESNSASSVGAVHTKLQVADATPVSITSMSSDESPMTQTDTGPAGPSSPTAHVPSKVIVPPAPTTVFDADTDNGTELTGAGTVVAVVVGAVVVAVVVVGVGVVVLLVVVVVEVVVLVVVVLLVVTSGSGSTGGTDGPSASVELGTTAGKVTSFVPDGPTPLSMKRPQVAMAAESTTVPAPFSLFAIPES